MATCDEFDHVVRELVEHLALSSGMILRLDLKKDAIAEVVELGFTEWHGETLYPTQNGKEYYKGMDLEEEV